MSRIQAVMKTLILNLLLRFGQEQLCGDYDMKLHSFLLLLQLGFALNWAQPTVKHLDDQQCSRDTYRTTLEANFKLDEVKKMTSDLDTKITNLETGW